MNDDIPRLFDDHRANRLLAAACLAVLVAVPILQSIRGLDMTDTGWVLANQRLIFSHPERSTYWFHLWFTNIVGGVVDLLFGRFGILPHKLAAAGIFWATAAGILWLYSRKVPRHLILAGLAAAMCYDFAGKINIVHYDNLSALLYVMGAAALCAAAERNERRLYSLSGFLFSLNAFARLPNVIGLGLVAVPWALGLFIRRPEDRYRLGWKDYVAFMAGAIFAAAACFAAMAALGHLGYYFNSIKDLTNTHSVDAGSYGVGAQFRRPLRDIRLSLMYGFPFAMALGLVSAGLSAFRQKLVKATLLVAVALVAYFFSPQIFAAHRTILYTPAGLCYWATLGVLLDQRRSRGLKLACVLATGACVALNFGSDTGINVASYLFPAMFPALLAFCRSVGSFRLGRGRVYAPLSASALVVLAFFAGFSVFFLKYVVYRDTSAMNRTAKVEQLAHVFTSEPRAAAFEKALPEITKFAPPGSVLFAYDSLGLIHFTTRTLPYLDNPWPALYSAEYMDFLLRKKESSEALPPLLMAKANPRYASWPENSEELVHMEVIRAFIERNGYSIAWEDPAFLLYLPKTQN